DQAEAQDRADRAIFSGNVVVKQGELTLRTARLTVAYASQNGIDINRIDASGGVTVVSPSETATGDFGVYDLDQGLITLVGNVRLERGGSFLSGGRLTIDLDSGRAVMDGGLRGINQGGGGPVAGPFTVPPRNNRSKEPGRPPSSPRPVPPARRCAGWKYARSPRAMTGARC